MRVGKIASEVEQSISHVGGGGTINYEILVGTSLAARFSIRPV